MVKKLLKFIGAIYFAVAYGEGLSSDFGFIPFSDIGRALFPNESSLSRLVEFSLWTIVFWLLITASLSALRFAASGGIARYGATKPVRIIQGISAELFMVSIIWVTGLLILTATPLSGIPEFANAAIEAEVLAYKDKIRVAKNAALAKADTQAAIRKEEISTLGNNLNNLLAQEMAYQNQWKAHEFYRFIETSLGYHWSIDSMLPQERALLKRAKSNHREFEALMAVCKARNVGSDLLNPKADKGERRSFCDRMLRVGQKPAANLNTLRSAWPFDYHWLQHQEYLTRSSELREQLSAKESAPSVFVLPVREDPDFAKSITVARGSFWQRFGPTVEKHRWMLLAALFIWGATRFAFRESFSKYYSMLMRFLDEGRMGFGGSARFAGMFEEWGKSYQKGSLYMGRSLFNPFQEIGLKDEAHMLTIAASRGGKGATAIIPNLLLWEGSCVVIDPKGTNAKVTAEARRKMGHDVHLIDPFGIVSKDSASFDPFEGLNPDDDLIREHITSIADALVIPDETTKDKHWDDGARTIISGLIAHIISTGVYQNPKLYTIRDLINQLPEDQDRLWAEMAHNAGAGGHAKDAAMRYIRGADTNEILSIMSNADKHTEWLSSKAMRKVLANPTFKLSDLKKKPTTVYLIIPPRQLKRQSRLLRLFINLMIDTMERGPRSKIPVLMIMDEFLALGKMPEIEDAFATMASYNLTLWPFVQELAKLKAMYGGSFNAFLANSRAVQVFGVSDPETTKYISERLGNRPLGSLGQIARSNENIPLRSPDDIEKDVSKDYKRQYIIEAGKPPLILEKVPYYDSRPISFLNFGGRFKGKFASDPDYS